MTTKLTQKEMVTLFAKEIASTQNAVKVADDNYIQALGNFACNQFGMAQEEWRKAMDKAFEEWYEIDGDRPAHTVTTKILAEATLKRMIQRLEEGGIDEDDLGDAFISH
jgi:hypothetical protein